MSQLRCINDSAMETKRYQGFSEGMDKEKRWAQVPEAMEYFCTMEEESKTNSDILMDIVNIACSPSTIAVKENRGEKPDQTPAPLSQNQQQFVFPLLNNTGHSCKQEMDSKELSKTVAESMGLYMNAAREVDYGFGQQTAQGGDLVSDGKLFPSSGQHPASVGRPKPKPLNLLASAPYPVMSRPSNVPTMACRPAALPGTKDALAPSQHCSPHASNGAKSSPVGSNLVSSTSSPTNFEAPCPSMTSPSGQAPALPGLGHVHHGRIPSACSPVHTNSVGSPLASPLNVMRSPISSPQSMGSVRSPPSCNPAARSSVSSPTGGNKNNSSISSSTNMQESMSSPGKVNAMSVSSPPTSTAFHMSSPVSGLGLVQKEDGSPEKTDRDFKGFEFPKVEKVDGELYSVGLDQMGMVKYIKNEPDGLRSMCVGNERGHVPHSPFTMQIKTEPDKDTTHLNPHYNGQQNSLAFFPPETTYLSLRDNVDEHSLSGILGPPVSSLNGNYQPDAFVNSVLPKGIKEESKDGSYYQENNNMPTSAIVGVNSGGHSFHYQIGAQGTMSFSRHDVRDQSNPLLNLISPVTALMESWKPRSGLAQNPMAPRVEAFPGQRCITENMASAIRNPSSSSSSAKVCLVCGDEASGCHYGVVTCGSCKVFFKRAIEGQHNYLCAGRNDCIIDKIRRKNCPACRVRKCLQAGMNLGARKSKKLGKLKGISEDVSLPGSKEGHTHLAPEKELGASSALVPHVSAVTPYLAPPICSMLELIEPEVVYAGYDNTQPDTTDHLLSSLNQLAGKQMIRVVKWAKVLPGFRNLPIEDQITLIQYSWMCLSSFALSWRSYKHTNGQMLYFAPDLVFNEERMQQSAMYELCVGMRQVSQEFVRLQLTHEEFLAMKVLLLLSTVPKDGLKNQAVFEEMRMNYIKELRRSVGNATNNSGQTWPRFYQLTKLLDAMHDLVGDLLDFCFYTFRESQALKVEFPEMLVEIISDQLPKVESGLTHTLYFHKK
ncbi:mineralocorticoid receptor-like [Megalops cyprinoides]|uniref:mineralocorticoid receptor-like n=1 Tax=Megalops cyprinoides TaxID=118141 RepID=UPI001864CC95|nr:mineralocorticoid receptor-like [Megalops cyprinoides]